MTRHDFGPVPNDPCITKTILGTVFRAASLSYQPSLLRHTAVLHLAELTNERRQSHSSKCSAMMSALKERIAAVALHTFDDLPTKSKPRSHADGSREWVPMSAVVLVRGIHSKPASSHEYNSIADLA